MSDAHIFANEDALATDERLATAPSIRPIQFGQIPLGRIALGARGRGVSTEDERLLGLLATQLGGPLRMAALVEESRRLAATDTLTGLMNRRAFTEAVVREIATADRYQFPISLLMLDVDHLQERERHRRARPRGTLVLVALASVLGTLGRKSDYVARWVEGRVRGDPLAHRTRRRAHRERAAAPNDFGDANRRSPNGPPLSVTASIGVAMHRSKESLEELIARADAAMYAAKTSGRNRVEVA